MVITCDCARLRVETKCLASKASEGNLSKKLSCDDECGRLKRNQELAQALNIDPATHSDDHIPYSSVTLRIYQEHSQWCLEQEKTFRLFAADDEQRRVRFKPMPKQQRKFLHSLSGDFGFESESLDPEPHRHIVVFKTPKFAKAPMKTLSDCLRIRVRLSASQPAASSAPVSDSEAADRRPRATPSNAPLNGFVLEQPRFGLTIDELRRELAPLFAAAAAVGAKPMAFDVAFLPSEEIVLRARAAAAGQTLGAKTTAARIAALVPLVAALIRDRRLAAAVAPCTLDASLNVTRRQDPGGAAGEGGGEDGWSTVAAKGPLRALPVAAARAGVGGRNSFVVLGRTKKVGEAARRKEERREEVVEDWEQEMREEEEDKERSLERPAESMESSEAPALQHVEVAMDDEASRAMAPEVAMDDEASRAMAPIE